MRDFKPFENESDVITLSDPLNDAELTIENRIDRVSIFGSLDITKDKAGLRQAKDLQSLLGAILDVLEKSDLPDKIEPDKDAIVEVENPFGQ